MLSRSESSGSMPPPPKGKQIMINCTGNITIHYEMGKHTVAHVKQAVSEQMGIPTKDQCFMIEEHYIEIRKAIFKPTGTSIKQSFTTEKQYVGDIRKAIFGQVGLPTTRQRFTTEEHHMENESLPEQCLMIKRHSIENNVLEEQRFIIKKHSLEDKDLFYDDLDDLGDHPPIFKTNRPYSTLMNPMRIISTTKKDEKPSKVLLFQWRSTLFIQDQPTDTVAMLKNKIQTLYGIPIAAQQLIAEETLMDDNEPIEKYRAIFSRVPLKLSLQTVAKPGLRDDDRKEQSSISAPAVATPAASSSSSHTEQTTTSLTP